jgi:hypothetical protein
MEALPTAVHSLQSAGLVIKECDDIRSYKKIIPTLQLYPDTNIVIADDDVCYPPQWLEELHAVSVTSPQVAVCRRGHRINYNCDGSIAPYTEWTMNVGNTAPDPDIFATGMGGVFYPAGIFHEDVHNIALALELCPTADDVWLYWMVRLKGGVFQKIGDPVNFVGWKGTENNSLYQMNVMAGRNDEQVANITHHFGIP